MALESIESKINKLLFVQKKFEQEEVFNSSQNMAYPPRFLSGRINFSTSLKKGKQLTGWNKANVYLESIESFDPFDIQKLIFLNSLICENDYSKSLRNSEIYIGKFSGTATLKLEKVLSNELKRLHESYCNIQDTKHFFTFLADYSSTLITIHPFTDGNGRTTSLLIDKFLVQNDFLPENFDSKLDFMFGRFLELNHPPSIDQIANQIIENVLKSYSTFMNFDSE